MAYSKVVHNSETLIDLTQDTVLADNLLYGQTAHNARGELVTGTRYANSVTQDQDGYIILNDDGDNAVRYTLEDIAEHKYATDRNIVTFNGTVLYPYQFANGTLTQFSSDTLLGFGDGHNTGGYVFEYCSNLESYYAPNQTYSGSGGYQFYNCTSLTDFYAPKTYIGANMLRGCTSLKNVAIYQTSSVMNMNGSGFYQCSNLEKVDICNCSRIHTSEFYQCTKLKTLVLRRPDAIIPLNNINAFNNTPFASGGSGGTIYAPSSLIDTYKSATNWSTINGYGTVTWVSLEGSEYENKYVDGRSVA